MMGLRSPTMLTDRWEEMFLFAVGVCLYHVRFRMLFVDSLRIPGYPVYPGLFDYMRYFACTSSLPDHTSSVLFVILTSRSYF